MRDNRQKPQPILKKVVSVKNRITPPRSLRRDVTTLGKFNVLVNFWLDACDVVLKTLLATRTKDASKVIENEDIAINARGVVPPEDVRHAKGVFIPPVLRSQLNCVKDDRKTEYPCGMFGESNSWVSPVLTPYLLIYRRKGRAHRFGLPNDT